jgi:putative hydrolase of the HAD superfamily
VTDGVVFWDFDGTLAQRPGLWSTCVLEVLNDIGPGHGITRDAIRVGLADAFPWHTPEIAHPELCQADAWWLAVGTVIAGALVGVGISETVAARLVPLVRERYCNAEIGWELFDDTLPALRASAEAGWRNVVLSNHVPELRTLVDGLGLTDYIEAVFSSASTGYEKPHPESFRLALQECGNPAAAFMVGDNPVADVQGAEAVGLPAVLVRREGAARYSASGLQDAIAIILASSTRARSRLRPELPAE